MLSERVQSNRNIGSETQHLNILAECLVIALHNLIKIALHLKKCGTEILACTSEVL